MPDEQKKRQEPDEERDAKVPPTGAKTDSAVEPEDDYDLDSPIEIDAGDGAPEPGVKKVGVPPTGAKSDSAVEPEDDYDLDSPIEIDAGDGALEPGVKKVGVPPTGAKSDSAVEPEDDYDLDIGEDEDEDGEE